MKFDISGFKNIIKTKKSKDVKSQISSEKEEFPLLPLRELVIFPQTLMSVFITYKSGIAAVEEALKRDMRLFAACQKSRENPMEASSSNENREETWEAGTVVRIIQNLKLPDNTYRVVLQGEYRALLSDNVQNKESKLVYVKPIKASSTDNNSEDRAQEISALMRAVQKSFAQYAENSKKISTEIISAAEKTESPERMVNIISNSLAIKADRKVELVKIADTNERLFKLLEIIETENEIFGIQKNITGKVRSRMDKNQRDFILNEQLREINKELGKSAQDDEFTELEKSIVERKPGEEILAKAKKEISRLRKLQAFSPEAGVLRTYLDWIVDLPWSEYTVDSNDLNNAQNILDEDHYEMKKAKERIIEYIAVKQLSIQELPESSETKDETDKTDETKDIKSEEKVKPPVTIKGPILCFVGAPGTGKTSLGKSVARALGRKFIRISLGGVRDEAEIRGHRKTYVGALPGKIIQSMKKAGTLNPVFLLDEIDKLSRDFRGDPASALLEVLDPEQNSSFTDHYMEVPYDLSKVLFITTANSLHSIPYPLLDRMEVIEIPGYGENEKLAIAQKYLVPKELNENGLAGAKISFEDHAIKDIIRYWTMESGVRNLEREIARCIRRIAKSAVNSGYGRDKENAEKNIDNFRKKITVKDLEKLLGRRKYKNDVVYKEARMGVSYGLAYTDTGGTMLPVETILFDGSGENTITGNIGDVMKESAKIALSYLRSVQDHYSLKVKNIAKTDFHIHVPEGAIPKDGPSAGITLAASILSCLCQIAPKAGISMTGELTLTGRILPVGGLKEKLLAAIRNGMAETLLPEDNRDDYEELSDDIKKAINIHFVDNAESAFKILFDESIFKTKTKNKGKNRAS